MISSNTSIPLVLAPSLPTFTFCRPALQFLNFYFMTSRMFRLCILATAWIILGSAAPTHPKTPVVPAVKEISCYWFWADSDFYVEYCKTSDACTDFGNWTGKLVNTSSAGGTLVANGYLVPTQPHSGWPQVQLYSH